MKRSFFYILLIIPTLAYIYVALQWSQSPHQGVTGDEPHYLMITKSIVNDFDLDVKNNYDYDAIHAEIFGAIDRHAIAKNGHEYGLHLFGLPILLSVPFYFFGIAGAKAFMCFSCGLVAILAYHIFQSKLKNRAIASSAAAVFCLSLPFVIAAQQIYCEFITGLIFCWSILVLFKMLDQKPIHLFQRFLWIMCLSYLSLVHIKNVLPVFTICATYFTICLVQLKEQTITLKSFFHQISVLIIPPIFIFILAWYLYQVNGSFISSPYYSSPISFNLLESIRTFLMFHFDQSDGLFMQNPFAIIGLLGLIPLFIDNRIKGVVFLLVYLSLMILHSMVLGFFDGPGFLSSRFTWAPAVLWLIPIGFGLKYLKENYAVAIPIILITSFCFQLINAVHWINIDPNRINWEGQFIWPYDSLSPYFPNFKPDLSNIKVNVIYLMGFLLVAVSGSPSNWRIRNLLIPTWGSYAIVSFGILSFAPPKLPLMRELILTYKDVSTVPGKEVTLNDDRYWQPVENNQEYVWFGPYMPLKKGEYEVIFALQVRTKGVAGENIAGIDISSEGGKNSLAGRAISRSDTTSSNFKLLLHLEKDTPSIEFRVYKFKNSMLNIHHISIKQIAN